MEQTQTQDVMGFETVAFPMVRRVMAKLLADKIVSVQAMSLPSGLLFYLDHQVKAPGGSYQSVYDAHYGNSGFSTAYGTATAVQTPLVVVSNNTALTQYSGGEQGLASLQIVVHSAATDVTSGFSQFVINPQTWTQD
ncbi:MAG: hypothetical protein ACFFG0_19680, partial [Candidatus Thorarchaeota archaeon]